MPLPTLEDILPKAGVNYSFSASVWPDQSGGNFLRLLPRQDWHPTLSEIIRGLIFIPGQGRIVSDSSVSFLVGDWKATDPVEIFGYSIMGSWNYPVMTKIHFEHTKIITDGKPLKIQLWWPNENI